MQGQSEAVTFSVMKKLFSVVLLLSLLTPVAQAANTPTTPQSTPTPTTPSTPTTATTPQSSPTPTEPSVTLQSEMARITTLLNAKDFKGARAQLLLIDKKFTNNADVNNLLGFTSRKLKMYSDSAMYYTKALKINPNHLGALEYQGELFVATKKIAAAKSNLAKLKMLCGLNCEEYKDLKKAIGKK